MKRMLATTLTAALALVVSLSLVACGGDEGQSGGEAPSEPATVEQDAQQSDAASGGDLVVPAGFPAGMPLPDGTTDVSDDPASGGHRAFVPGRDCAEVIAELESALPESGWTILEQTSDIGTRGDRLFVVESGGQKMNVFVEPKAGSEEDTSVLYYE